MIITVAEPFTVESGGPTQVQLSPITAAGRLPINTVGAPGPIIGPPTWGIGEGTAGVCMGHVCMSVILDAGGIRSLSVVKCWKHTSSPFESIAPLGTL